MLYIDSLVDLFDDKRRKDRKKGTDFWGDSLDSEKGKHKGR